MPNLRLLILLSVLVLEAAIWAMITFTPNDNQTLGSLFAAAGSFLAVIWFSGSLNYQAQQLKEQREQFLTQFAYLRADARRNALNLSKDILRDAEELALKSNPQLTSIEDIPTEWMKSLSFYKVIMESTDPNQVMDAIRQWIIKEGSAIHLFGRHQKRSGGIFFCHAGI